MPDVFVRKGGDTTRKITVDSSDLTVRGSGWVDVPNPDGEGTVAYPVSTVHRIEYPEGGTV